MAKTIVLREIAEATGVSISTVSRALRDDPRVGKNTRRRIKAAQATLSAEAGAVRTVARQAVGQCLALVLPDHEGRVGDTEVSIAVLECLQDVCEQHEWTVVTGRLRPGLTGRAALGLPTGLDVSGVIGYRLHDGDVAALTQAAHQARLPFVLLNRLEPEGTGFACGVDHRQAGRIAARHLIDLGHRRIGTVFGRGDVQSSRLRREGIQAELERAGLTLEPALQVLGVEQPRAAREAAREAVRRGATALIFDSDRQAIGAQGYLIDQGYRVPRDVSLIGFDGTDAAALASPALASIYTPWREMTRAAAQLLLMRDRDSLLGGGQLLWQPKLIAGESCARPSLNKSSNDL